MDRRLTATILAFSAIFTILVSYRRVKVSPSSLSRSFWTNAKPARLDSRSSFVGRSADLFSRPVTYVQRLGTSFPGALLQGLWTMILQRSSGPARRATEVPPPPPDSLYERLWRSNQDITEKVLYSSFVLGIRTGTLNPTTYARWTVIDAYYCYHAAADYTIAATRANGSFGDAALSAFLSQKRLDYDAYNFESFGKAMNLQDARSIIPSRVIAEYVQLEAMTAQKLHPVYTLIVHMPCDRLWNWLGLQLQPYVRPGNLYGNWVDSLIYPGVGFDVGNFLEAYEKQFPGVIDEAIAQRLYRRAMELELENFNSV